MKKYIYSLMAIAALAAVSCVPDPVDPVTPEEKYDETTLFSVNPTSVVSEEGADSLVLTVLSEVPFEVIVANTDTSWVKYLDTVADTTNANLSYISFAVAAQKDVEDEARAAKITFKNTVKNEILNTRMSTLTIAQEAAEGLSVSITQPGAVDFRGALAADNDILYVYFKSNVDIEPVIADKDTNDVIYLGKAYDSNAKKDFFAFEVTPNASYDIRIDTLGVKRVNAADTTRNRVLDGKFIYISTNPADGLMLIIDGEDYLVSNTVSVPAAGADVVMQFMATCPVKPYFGNGAKLAYAFNADSTAISFTVPANDKDVADKYKVMFTNADSLSTKALLRDPYTGEAVALNIIGLAALTGFDLKEEASFEIEYTKSCQLTPVFTPAGAAEGREIEWSSSDETLLTVEDGLVTAVGVGTATITAKVEDFTVTRDITVPWAISISETEAAVRIGKTHALSVSFVPELLASSKTIVWTSSDESVATVSASGVVTGVAEGDAVITATVDKKSVECAIRVAPYLSLFAEDFSAFDDEGWSFFDADGDGYQWDYKLFSSGASYMVSNSYDDNVGALTPDNWIFTPVIQLEENENFLYFLVQAADLNYPNEKFALYITDVAPTADNISSLEPIYVNTLSKSAYWDEHLFAIPEEFNGKEVYVGLRHYDCTDMYMLILLDLELYYGNPAVSAPSKASVNRNASKVTLPASRK